MHYYRQFATEFCLAVLFRRPGYSATSTVTHPQDVEAQAKADPAAVCYSRAVPSSGNRVMVKPEALSICVTSVWFEWTVRPSSPMESSCSEVVLKWICAAGQWTTWATVQKSSSPVNQAGVDPLVVGYPITISVLHCSAFQQQAEGNYVVHRWTETDIRMPKHLTTPNRDEPHFTDVWMKLLNPFSLALQREVEVAISRIGVTSEIAVSVCKLELSNHLMEPILTNVYAIQTSRTLASPL
ncbi:hypothetical protein C8J56DRAFT_48018 [Mycena floridula]|nr:hypothetical protein C8J56DRAFT_407184 [Mycena floridula]KAJ7588520.1 hypothetical protein C8J56DRAFT_48018 [Mycena floridula]